MMTSKEIYAELSERVFGHSRAKKTLINHINRVQYYYYNRYVLGRAVEYTPNVTFLVGHSGTGKTELVKSLGKILDLPIMYYDATEIQPISASHGTSVEDIRKDIQKFAATLCSKFPDRFFSIEGARSQIILFIDEMDKLGKSYDGTNNDWNNKTQASLLSLLEDSELRVSYILAGAFSQMKYGSQSIPEASIGFTSPCPVSSGSVDDNLDEMMLKSGLMAEIVGRVTQIAKLDILEFEDYLTILRKYILPDKIEYLMIRFGLEYDFPDALLESFVTKALKSNQGIRHMRRSIDEHLIDTEFEASVTDHQKCLTSSENVV